MVESSSSSDRVSGSSGGGPVSDEELFDLYLEGALAGETREPREFLEDHGRSGASELVGRLEQIREMAATSQVERSAADGLPFARLGEFRLIDRLGQGAMGVVYLAEQTSLGRLVALKVLRSELIGGGPAERRFEHEARALAKIEHPGVVRLYGFGVDQGRRFLAMELVPGESLDEKIEREGSLSPVQAARWGLELARALDRVHGVGLLHRDVKPSNIRIHEDGRAILVDFGLSKGAGAESARRTAGFVGSVGYASPEQVRGNVELDARADVYSLGATLYHVLAGRPPFDGDELEPVLHAILKSDLPALQRIAPAVPRDLATVVACAMERDARRRYASAAALAADLEAVLALRPISARPPSAIEIAIKWLRRNRAAAVALAVALSALLALAAVLALQGRWERERVRSEARAALERARTAVEQHRVDREAMTQLDSELAMLAINTEHGHMRASERRRYWELVDEVEAARRRRAGVGFVVMDALARAVRLDDGLGDDASEVRAALLREQWADALASGEAAELRALELELSALDSTQGSERLPAHPVQVVAEPATRSWLFRLEELGVHDPKAVPRQVPVPVSLDGRTVLEAPVGPGTWVLRAARPSPEIGPLERVVSVDGYALEGGPLVREAPEDSPLMPGDRVVAVRGEQPRDAADAMMYATPGLVPHEARVAPPSVALIERDGQRLEVEAAALLEATLWGLQERLTALGGRAQVLRSGGLLERDLPAGIEWRLSAFALAPLPGNRFEGPRELELPRGHYVLLSHRSGHQLVRSYVSVDGLRGRYEIEIEPRPTSFAPEGFVHLSISAPSARWAFWIAEFEVLAKDYLEFLNDPQTRAEVNVAWELGQASRVPRGGGGRFERRTLWPRGSDGLFLLPPEIDPREPVLGISWEDATAYVDWLNRRGGPGRFYLGGEAEHASAGCYAGDRRFSYGARFDQRAANTCFSRPVARPEVVGSHPIDESPLGVYDLCGNAAELIDAWFDKPNGYRYAIGGAWGQAPGEVNRVLGGGGHRPDSTTGETGMRLLWAPDDEATER